MNFLFKNSCFMQVDDKLDFFTFGMYKFYIVTNFKYLGLGLLRYDPRIIAIKRNFCCKELTLVMSCLKISLGNFTGLCSSFRFCL
jgi:hypothetical protein